MTKEIDETKLAYSYNPKQLMALDQEIRRVINNVPPSINVPYIAVIGILTNLSIELSEKIRTETTTFS